MRREDLLKPDVVSEAILLGVGLVVFAVLFLILFVVLTKGSAPQNQSKELGLGRRSAHVVRGIYSKLDGFQVLKSGIGSFQLSDFVYCPSVQWHL